jgi:predicted transcriptional regulator
MLQKFATQVEDRLIDELKKLARTEGRQIQSLIGEALQEYIARKLQGKTRPEVLEHFQRSTLQFGSVYQSLVEKK